MAIRDPFQTPTLLHVEDGRDGACFVGQRATEPAFIIGATLGPPCERCGTRVWVAPSSRSWMPLPRVFCFPCFVRRYPHLQELALAAFVKRLGS